MSGEDLIERVDEEENLIPELEKDGISLIEYTAWGSVALSSTAGFIHGIYDSKNIPFQQEYFRINVKAWTSSSRGPNWCRIWNC